MEEIKGYCRDCEHFYEGKFASGRSYGWFCNKSHISTKADGYCSDFAESEKKDRKAVGYGTWDINEDDEGIYGICSECCCDTDFSHTGEPYPYCPYCGTPMKIKAPEVANENG